MTDIKKGDRVRITFEGEVRWINTRYLSVENDAKWLGEIRHDLVSVEKIEPPVEVFKRGDVVRHRRLPGYHYSIGNDGYLCLKTGRWCTSDVLFTSEEYEKVDLSAVS